NERKTNKNAWFPTRLFLYCLLGCWAAGAISASASAADTVAPPLIFSRTGPAIAFNCPITECTRGIEVTYSTVPFTRLTTYPVVAFTVSLVCSMFSATIS
ncbi:hypothetical protein BDR26DRAFT_872216, partial [Obelidium mucronatum]